MLSSKDAPLLLFFSIFNILGLTVVIFSPIFTLLTLSKIIPLVSVMPISSTYSLINSNSVSVVRISILLSN